MPLTKDLQGTVRARRSGATARASVGNWFVRQRQEWIAETLRVFGFINREHLQRKFGISQPQASADLTTFQRGNTGAMTYDTSRKCYVAQI